MKRSVPLSSFSYNPIQLRLVEETEAHVAVLLLALLLLFDLLLLLLLDLLLLLGRCGGRGRSSELARILEELLEGLGLLELDVGGGGDGQQVLESVGDGVRRRRHGRVADLQRDGGNVGHAAHELGAQVLGLDVQNVRAEDAAAVVHLLDGQAVAERRDVKHVKESGLAGADLVAGLDQRNVVLSTSTYNLSHRRYLIVINFSVLEKKSDEKGKNTYDDFDGSSCDLGGDLQGLEEAGLLWTECGHLSRQGDIARSDRAGLGWSSDLFSIQSSSSNQFSSISCVCILFNWCVNYVTLPCGRRASLGRPRGLAW